MSIDRAKASLAPGARRAGFVQGLTLLLPCTMAVMGVLVLAPVVPKLMEAFKDTPHAEFWVPIILTTPSLCLAIFSPLAGMLGDLFGRRRLLIIGTVFYAGFGMAPILLNNLWAILATRVGVGVCEATVLTLSTTLIGDFFKGQTRDRWLAAQMAVASIGAILCLMAGGILGGLFGWRGPFAIYGVVLLLALAVGLFTWEPGPEERESAKVQVSWAGFPWRALGGICAITFVASILVYTLQLEMGVALTALGIKDPSRIGLLTALASLGVSLGTLIFQAVTRTPMAALLAVEFLIIGISYIAMGRTSDPNTFLIASAVNQVGAGMLMPTLLTWAVRQLRFEIRGRGTGIWQGVFSVGQFFAGLLLPVTAAIMGGVVASFQLLGLVGAAAGGLSLIVFLARGRGAPRPAPLGEGRNGEAVP